MTDESNSIGPDSISSLTKKDQKARSSDALASLRLTKLPYYFERLVFLWLPSTLVDRVEKLRLKLRSCQQVDLHRLLKTLSLPRDYTPTSREPLSNATFQVSSPCHTR